MLQLSYQVSDGGVRKRGEVEEEDEMRFWKKWTNHGVTAALRNTSALKPPMSRDLKCQVTRGSTRS